MAVSLPFGARLSYWLRLTVTVMAAPRHVFTLLRQGDRNVKILLRTRRAVGFRRLSLAKRITSLVSVPLRHYFAVLRASPQIAGANAWDYQRRLHETHARVKLLSDGLPEGRSFLSNPSVRRLQRHLVPLVFEEEFAIRITPEQATSFSCYAESSELVLDFLDFCHHNNQFGSKAGLLAALPVFEQLVKPFRFDTPKDCKHGPQRGKLCQQPLPPEARVRMHSNWLRPVQTLVNLYWGSFDTNSILGSFLESPYACEQLEQHFAGCTESPPETLLGVLAFEMHKQACVDLVPMATYFHPPETHQFRESSAATDPLTQCLPELEESMRQATGLGAKKAWGPEVSRV